MNKNTFSHSEIAINTFKYCMPMLISVLLPGCEKDNKKDILIYDEIIFEEYQMEMLSSKTTKELNEELKEFKQPYLTAKYEYTFLYKPNIIFKINKNGGVLYFRHPSADSLKNGYFESNLTNNASFHMNKILEKIDILNTDSFYSGVPGEPIDEMAFNYPRYYIGLKMGKEFAHCHIYRKDNTPKELVRLVEFLQYLSGKIELKPSSDSSLFEVSRNIFESELRTSPVNYQKKRIKFEPPK